MIQGGGTDVSQSEVAEIPLPKIAAKVLNTPESCADTTANASALARTARSANISPEW